MMADGLHGPRSMGYIESGAGRGRSDKI